MDMRQALLGGASAVALGVGLLGSPQVVEAQQSQGLIVTQSGSRADAASFYAAPAATSCTTSQASIANLTITITPPAGQYVYLTGLFIEFLANATAASSATVWTATNLTGTPAWLANVTASASGVPTGEYLIAESYPTGLKSTVAGTPVTILPQATSASTFQCAKAVGYFSPT